MDLKRRVPTLRVMWDICTEGASRVNGISIRINRAQRPCVSAELHGRRRTRAREHFGKGRTRSNFYDGVQPTALAPLGWGPGTQSIADEFV